MQLERYGAFPKSIPVIVDEEILLYPFMIAPLFIGGVIGNSLFFYASGYLLKFKEEKYTGNWIVNKCIRILPSIWVFSVVAYLISFGGYKIEWYNFLYPTQF